MWDFLMGWLKWFYLAFIYTNNFQVIFMGRGSQQMLRTFHITPVLQPWRSRVKWPSQSIVNFEVNELVLKSSRKLAFASSSLASPSHGLWASGSAGAQRTKKALCCVLRLPFDFSLKFDFWRLYNITAFFHILNYNGSISMHNKFHVLFKN